MRQITNEKIPVERKQIMRTPKVRFLNPDTLHKNPSFTNVIVVSGSAKTIYVGDRTQLMNLAP